MSIVDLTLPIQPNYPYRRIGFEVVSTVAGQGYAVTRVTFDTHWGTHVDAPAHSLDGTRTVDQLDLNRCCGVARCLDLTGVARPNADIGVEDLEPFGDLITPGARVLLHTSWSRHFGAPAYHRDYPVLSVAAARWLAERRLALLGVDFPSVGPVWHEDKTQLLEVHRALLGVETVIVECLTNLAALPAGPFTFVAAPLPFVGGDGSPVRALALLDR